MSATSGSIWPTTPEERTAASDWRYEVANGDTVLGFRQWFANRKAEDQELAEQPVSEIGEVMRAAAMPEYIVEYDDAAGGGETHFLLRPEGVEGMRSDIHTVDFGNVAVDPTHTTRDGLPMEVVYAIEHGYSIAVNTNQEKS